MVKTENESSIKITTLKEYTHLDDHVFLSTFLNKTGSGIRLLTSSQYLSILENFDDETEQRKLKLVKFVEGERLTFREKITNILKLN